MIYQRPLYATFAILFCLSLGIITLYSNPRAKTHRLFAFYNFTLALFNTADFVVFFSSYEIALWYARIASMGGTFMIYYFLHFTYELTGFSETQTGKKTIRISMLVAIIFSILLLTPLMLKGVNLSNHTPGSLEIPGPLYPVYLLFAIFGLTLAVFPLWFQRRIASELQKKQITYIFAGSIVGVLSLSTYLLSIFWKDLPWLYYALEALFGFILIYAIFQFNLISITVALRRALLVVGIYIGLLMIVVPLVIVYKNVLTGVDTSTLILWIVLCGMVLSLGPVIYAHTVRHISLFQDTTISHLTHELKTPLHAIQSAKLVLEEELEAARPNEKKVKDYLAIIERNSDRLEKFVMDILNYSQSGGAGGTDTKELCNVDVVARDCVASWPKESERIVVRAQGDVSLMAVKEGLRQIFTNLLSNSLRHAPEGEIKIDIVRQANAVHVSVADHGAGIPKDHLSHIFDPFTRVKGSGAPTKGTGLGLTIAERWVRTHNGKIWAESEGLGHGTTFRFVLPVE